MMKKTISLSGWFLILTACSSWPGSPPVNRGPASIAQFPVVSSAGYASTSFDDYLEQVNRGRDPKNRLRASDIVITEHTEFYDELNAHYEDVVNGVVKLLGNPKVPRPKLLIVKAREVNAQVSGENACVNVNFGIVGGYAKGSKPKEKPGVQLQPYALSGFRQMDLQEASKMYASLPSPTQDFLFGQDFNSPCSVVSSGNEEEFSEDLGKKWLNFTGSVCRPRLGSNPPQFDCPDISASYSFRQAYFMRTLPYVFVNAGLIANMNSFEEFRSIVAHELGHYYLGHVYAMTTPRSYFYDRTAGGDAFRPAEDPALIELGNDLLATGDLRSGRSVPGIFSDSIVGEVLLTATRNLRRFSTSKKVPWRFDSAKCARFTVKDDFSGAWKDAIKFLYAENVSAEEAAKWKRFFEDLRECTRSVRSVSGQDEDYQRYFRSSPPRMEIMGVLLRGYKAPRAANAWDAFVGMQPHMAAQAARLRNRDSLAKVGYYTLEEEADIFALNYLLSYGYSPVLLQSALANLARSRVEKMNGQGQEAECLQAFSNGWQQKDRQPYIPLPLQYEDLHHSFCFRLYDVESLAKRLGRFEPTAAPKTDSNYAAIRERYRQIVSELPADQ